MRTITTALSAVSAAIVLSACGGASPPEVLSGRLGFPVISGLDYVSDARAGFTDSNGGFEYWKDGGILFSVGAIKVAPLILGGPYYGVSALTGTTAYLTDARSLNTLSFLLAIDDDADPNNGIQIPAGVRDEAKNLSIDLWQPVASFRTDPKVANVVRQLSTRTTAGQRPLLPLASVRTAWDKVLLAPMAGMWSVEFNGNPASTGTMTIRSSLSTPTLVAPSVHGNPNYAGSVTLEGDVQFGCPEPILVSDVDPMYCAEFTGTLQFNNRAAGTWRHPVTGKSGSWAATRVSAF